VHFVQPAFPTRQVPQTVADGDHVKGIFRKRQLLRVALKKNRRSEDGRQRSEVGGRIFILASVFGDGQHFFTEIKAGGFRAALGEREGDVAGAAS